MKTDITDIIWAVTSLFIVGWSYSHGRLIYGVVVILALMVILLFFHIARIRGSLARGISVFGTVTDYQVKDKNEHFYPVVSYKTEDGRDITSAYAVQSRKQQYEIGEEVIICYDPYEPVFFYFPERENDMTREYNILISVVGAAALILFLIAQNI